MVMILGRTVVPLVAVLWYGKPVKLWQDVVILSKPQNMWCVCVSSKQEITNELASPTDRLVFENSDLENVRWSPSAFC